MQNNLFRFICVGIPSFHYYIIVHKVLRFGHNFLLNNPIVGYKKQHCKQRKIYIIFFHRNVPLCWIKVYMRMDSNKIANCCRRSLVVLNRHNSLTVHTVEDAFILWPIIIVFKYLQFHKIYRCWGKILHYCK